MVVRVLGAKWKGAMAGARALPRSPRSLTNQQAQQQAYQTGEPRETFPRSKAQHSIA